MNTNNIIRGVQASTLVALTGFLFTLIINAYAGVLAAVMAVGIYHLSHYFISCKLDEDTKIIPKNIKQSETINTILVLALPLLFADGIAGNIGGIALLALLGINAMVYAKYCRHQYKKSIDNDYKRQYQSSSSKRLNAKRALIMLALGLSLVIFNETTPTAWAVTLATIASVACICFDAKIIIKTLNNKEKYRIWQKNQFLKKPSIQPA